MSIPLTILGNFVVGNLEFSECFGIRSLTVFESKRLEVYRGAFSANGNLLISDASFHKVT